jgi:hypothetical protein
MRISERYRDAQTSDQGRAWRTLAEQLEAGAPIEMRLSDGKHFKATFIAAHPDTVLLQRKTRIPVPVEEITYDSIATLSRVQPSSMSGGKIAGIALGSAGVAVRTLFLILLAAFD